MPTEVVLALTLPNGGGLGCSNAVAADRFGKRSSHHDLSECRFARVLKSPSAPSRAVQAFGKSGVRKPGGMIA